MGNLVTRREVVIFKPDSLFGQASRSDRVRAAGLLLGLAGHCGANTELPEAVADLAVRACRQIRERAKTELTFRGHINARTLCATNLMAAVERLSPEPFLRTVDVAILALRGLGFEIARSVDHRCDEADIDGIYGQITADVYRDVRPQLVGYLNGQIVRVCWLEGDQDPCVLQHWKTYVRHLLLNRPTGGTFLLRNLVHVCDGPDALYLTELLARLKEC